MTVRPPSSLTNPGARAAGFDLLEYELMSERADALGRHGLKVETAIARLEACTDEGMREALLDEAADVVWSFFITRELCGLRSNKDAIARYRIPRAVIARLGVVRKPSTD